MVWPPAVTCTWARSRYTSESSATFCFVAIAPSRAAMPRKAATGVLHCVQCERPGLQHTEFSETQRRQSDRRCKQCAQPGQHYTVGGGGSGGVPPTILDVLKNSNAHATTVWQKKTIWRYHHCRSHLDYTTKRATLLSTLKKVDGVASDRAQLAESGWHRSTNEFLAIRRVPSATCGADRHRVPPHSAPLRSK